MRKILAAGMLCALASCDLIPDMAVTAAEPTTYRTVSYYDANPLERDAAAAWCNDNQGLADKIPSCGNAAISGTYERDRKLGWMK